jgi:uncharacterized protein (DUF4415 family)
MLLINRTYNEADMKQKKRVTKRVKTSRRVTRLEASARSRRRPRYLPDELAGMYKPLKKPVTLRLDADVLAWFQRVGRGYQTRINQALRKAMVDERKKSAR